VVRGLGGWILKQEASIPLTAARKKKLHAINQRDNIFTLIGQKTFTDEKTAEKHGHETRIRAGRVFSCFFYVFF